VGITGGDDTYGGQNLGAYISNSAINPANWTRSYSRSGYLDPLPPRSNYAVLANAHVTRILFDFDSPENDRTANAVEYTQDGGASKKIVKVKKEVILASGTVGSPTVLMYSGVGPKDVLTAAGVAPVLDLPGVGQHLQDHLSVSLQWNTDEVTAGSIYADKGPELNDPAYMSWVNDAVAYVSASTLMGAGIGDLHANTLQQIDTFANAVTSNAVVEAGFKAIYEVNANQILTKRTGTAEFLMGNNVDGVIRIGVAIQHPFSQGQIYITSNNPMNYPAIDPRYLSHPTDVTIMRESLKLIRRLGQTQPLKSSLGQETLPGADIQTDQEWEDWMRGQVFTEFHPSSTCAMLPRKQGGVVDANLRVYGLSNVRVADASIPPISFSAHLMGSTYGIAEQASTIIRNFHNIKPSKSSKPKPSTTSTATDGPESTISDDPSSGSDQPQANIGTSISHLSLWPLVLAVAMCFTFGLIP
jgi:choline dehydrogenase